MGIFDFFKKKRNGIEDSKFNSTQFQNEICALALWKLEENDLNPNIAIYELKKVGLNTEQINSVLEKTKTFLNKDLNISHSQNLGIEEIKFNSEDYQKEILDYAQKLYFQNNHRYEIVKHELFKDGLSNEQADEVVEKLQRKNSEMVNDFQKDLDSGLISEIKIQPNPEHKKENVGKEEIDKYIGYGAYQMERGDLENALELFDKAIELDENAALAYANKGKLFSLKNDNQKALFFINKALEIEPNHSEILDNKVGTLFDLLIEGKISEDEFIENINEILERDSENPNAIFYIIQHLLRQNQVDNALQNLIKLFKINFRDKDTLKLMLNIFGHLSEERALEQFNVFENEVNEEAKYQLKYVKGLYLKRIGKFDDAIKLYAELNKIQEFSWNFYQIAIMKNLQGKTEESLIFLKTTFNLEPELKEDAKNFPELQNIWTNPEFIQITK
ncbi:tetratricopeptide repeat protein [Flavobacterium ajazii]|uniref:tetratricopeptide repeat protein n=1 Tax=Flavobacterium ajazii TaxID=2692318 RepID=UPI0013CF57BA|nr:tetratricopeptide repeat protein [Flavobacterium ajazii]